LASLLRPLVDQDLAVVFYDMTTIRAAGLSEQDGDVRQFGMSKEGVVARQVMLGVVQTAEGLPLYHEVFDGNTAEVQTLRPTLEKIVRRFPVKRVIAVADRGLLSVENLEELKTIALPGGGKLEFILAVPGRRYGEFIELLQPLQSTLFERATQEVLGEATWSELRLIVAHDPDTARQASAKRDELIGTLQDKAQQWVGKLDAQDAGKPGPGRKLTDGGARARFYHEVADAHMARIIRVDMKSDLFNYDINDQALARARLMDGKLLLVTNVKDLTPAEVVKRYKSLADIERGFRVLKSEIEIGPIHHRLPDRIRAHAMICFIALILYRVMRTRLHASGAKHSPERALQRLRRIQHHRVTLNASHPLTGLSSIDQEQTDILAALTIKKPTLISQLTLL
jgi:transposase